MKALLDEGLLVLSDLLQSGAGTCHPETAERLHIDTVECQLQAALRAYLTEQGAVSPGSGSYE